MYCIVNKQIRGYQSSITSYNVVCGPPGPHSELLSPGLEESLLSVSETLYISHMPLLSIDMKTKVVQHVPSIKLENFTGSQLQTFFDNQILRDPVSGPIIELVPI